MDIRQVRREGREFLAALTEPELVHMSGRVGAAEAACLSTAAKIEELPVAAGAETIRAAADGLAALLEGGNEVAMTTVRGACHAAEHSKRAVEACARGLAALRVAAAAFQEADAAFIESQGSANVAAGHLNHYLNSLDTEE